MSFDLQVIRQQFPSLDRPAIFLDNPAGTQIAKHSLDRINKYFLECNANHEGMFETSRRSDEILHEAHAAMADFLRVSSRRDCFWQQHDNADPAYVTLTGAQLAGRR